MPISRQFPRRTRLPRPVRLGGGASGAVAVAAFACSSPSTTSAACAFLIASSVLVGSTARQISVSLSAISFKLGLPRFRLDSRRRRVARTLPSAGSAASRWRKISPSCFVRSLRRDVGVEVAVAEHLARGPHGLRVEVAHVRVRRVEQHPRLSRPAPAGARPTERTPPLPPPRPRPSAASR